MMILAESEAEEADMAVAHVVTETAVLEEIPAVVLVVAATGTEKSVVLLIKSTVVLTFILQQSALQELALQACINRKNLEKQNDSRIVL